MNFSDFGRIYYRTRYTGLDDHFENKLNRWEIMRSSFNPIFAINTLNIHEKIPLSKIDVMMRREQDKKHLDMNSYYMLVLNRTPIPQDPFSTPSGDRCYRYGLSPRKIIRSTNKIKREFDKVYYERYYHFPEAPCIIAGNGPDGDVDVEVTCFNAEPTTSTGKMDSFLGLGKNPIDLLYDPTNGATSNGDIFVIHNYSGHEPGPKPLWDEQDFKKRYGL